MYKNNLKEQKKQKACLTWAVYLRKTVCPYTEQWKVAAHTEETH